MVFVAALVALAIALAWPLPRLMARMTTFRRAPRAALVVWQSVSIAAVLSALAAAPAVLPEIGRQSAGAGAVRAWAIGAATLSGLMLAQLLVSGHQVGTRLRSLRRRHRELVDLLAEPGGEPGDQPGGQPGAQSRAQPGHTHLRVLEHPTPTAYCLPGLHSRVVLSQGTIDTLPPEELEAVLAHERAHLRARHDLILEFFTVMHTAVPPLLRSPEALCEVRLLAEVLADRSAVKAVGTLPMARALVALAGSAAPDAAMGAGGSTAQIRLDLLSEAARPRILLSFLMFGFAALMLGAPIALVVAGWAAR